MSEKNEDGKSAKKQLLLRIGNSLWEKMARWADEDFRSINGQIEFVLTEAVNKHFKSDSPDKSE